MLELFSSQTGLKAAVYCRVSSKMQLDGSSLTIQYESCARFIRSKSWTLVKTYTDEAISGARADRPAFQQMLKDAEAGHFDVIVVYALDRFFRSFKEKHSLVEVFVSKIKLDHHYEDGLVGIEFNYDFVTTSSV